MGTSFQVDGAGFFSLGGQAHNSSSDSPADLDLACAAVTKLGGNTVALPISWERFEPEEGVFDRVYVKELIERVRRAGLRLVVLWFATWKNGTMEYAPSWVKEDSERFVRTLLPNGEATFVLSCHSEANSGADAAAFRELMRCIREIDERERTVICVQVENESGIYAPVSRDFSSAGERDFAAPIPAELVAYARAHPGSLLAERLRDQDAQAPRGSWQQVFGPDAATACTAWHIARYVERVAAAGKEAYDLPMSVNAWVDAGNWGVAGLDYPSGGPVHFNANLDIWKAALRSVDLICPDVYVEDADSYRQIIDAYGGVQEALFVPESLNQYPNTSLMMYAASEEKAIGYHVFAVEDLLSADGELTAIGQAFRRSFAILNAVRPLFERREAILTRHTFLQLPGMRRQRLGFEGWIGYAAFQGPPFDWNAMDLHHLDAIAREREPFGDIRQEGGRGFAIQTGPSEFFFAGHQVRVMLQQAPPEDGSIPYGMINDSLQAVALPSIAIEEGHIEAGEFLVDRRRTGDEARHGIWLQAGCGLVRVRLTKLRGVVASRDQRES